MKLFFSYLRSIYRKRLERKLLKLHGLEERIVSRIQDLGNQYNFACLELFKDQHYHGIHSVQAKHRTHAADIITREIAATKEALDSIHRKVNRIRKILGKKEIMAPKVVGIPSHVEVLAEVA